MKFPLLLSGQFFCAAMTPISPALAKLPVTVLSGFLGAGKIEVESSQWQRGGQFTDPWPVF
jgi:hypothetical protein